MGYLEEHFLPRLVQEAQIVVIFFFTLKRVIIQLKILKSSRGHTFQHSQALAHP